MMTLSEFLLDRIAEDEAFANEARTRSAELLGYPTRALAECEAKRRIMTAYTGWDDDFNDGEPFPAYHGRGEHEFAGRKQMHWEVLQILAAVYGGHPDYREEWKPRLH